jgi:alpha-L-fucosidase
LGEIPQPSIDRLKQIGDWMKINSEAVYGTKASPFPYLPWGRATVKDQKLYLHVINWPFDGLLKLPLLNKPVKAYLLADTATSLKTNHADRHVEISLPAEAPDSVLSIVVLEFEGTPEVLPAPTSGKPGTASSVDTAASVSNLFDGNPINSWKPAPGETKAWIEVDLGEDVKLGNISLVEPWHPWDNHGQEFQLLVKRGEKWEEVIASKTNGCGHTQDFAPVTGRYFRLVITGGKGEVPVINEWILNRVL